MIEFMLVLVVLAILNATIAKKHLKLFLVLSTVILATLAYHIVAFEASDLYRYMGTMDLCREMGWEWIYKYYGPHNPLTYAFLYAIAMLNNDAILPALAVFVTYGLSFVLLYKASKKLESSFSEITIAYWFLILNMNFMYVATVIRFYIAFAIMSYFLYMDIIEKKNRPICFIAYLILCYYHYAMLVFLLLRVVFIFSRKLRGLLSGIGTVLIPVILMMGYTFVDMFGGGTSSLFKSASDRLQGYESYDVFGIWQFLASMVRVVVFVVICILAVLVCNKMQEVEKQKHLSQHELRHRADQINRFYDFNTFCLYLTITVITFITNFQFVLRTPYFIQTMISVVVLLTLAGLRKYDRRLNSVVRTTLIVESIAHLGYLMIYVYNSLQFA